MPEAHTAQTSRMASDPRIGALPFAKLKRFLKDSGRIEDEELFEASTKFALLSMAEKHSVSLELLLGTQQVPLEPVAAKAEPPIADFRELHALGAGCTIEKTELRGISLNQLTHGVWSNVDRRCLTECWASTDPSKQGELLTPESVNLYDLNHFLIRPATIARECSLVEVFAETVQPPHWFVSHWWGEPVKEFLACIEQHTFDHGFDPVGTHYWVCAYANNQHKLDNDVTTDPKQSAFHKALMLCAGTISVIDRSGVCFSRIWCDFEIFLSLKETAPHFKYEMYTALEHTNSLSQTALTLLKQAGKGHREHLRAVGLTDGLAGAVDLNAAGKGNREAAFPIEIGCKMLDLKLEDGQASYERDKKGILNAFAGRLPTDEPLRSHPGYDELNQTLHGRAAIALYPRVLASGGNVMRLGSAIQTSRAPRVKLYFGPNGRFSDDVAARLGAILPSTTMKDVDIFVDHRGGNTITSLGSRALFDAVAKTSSLRTLKLIGLPALPPLVTLQERGKLAVGLQELTLVRCELSGAIPSDLGECAALRNLALYNNQLSGPIPNEIGKCSALENLLLSNNQLDGKIPESIGRCVVLQKLFLDRNRLTGAAPASAIAQLTRLKQVSFEGNVMLSITQAGKAVIRKGVPTAMVAWPALDPADAATAPEREEAALEQQRASGGPVLQRLRGKCGLSVSHDVTSRILSLEDFPTVGAPGMLSASGIIYYELELLTKPDCLTPQIGFATRHFEIGINEYSGDGVGDDGHSWGVDGERQLLFCAGSSRAHNRHWPCLWVAGDIIGLAANVDEGKVAVSKNGSWSEEGCGIVFGGKAFRSGVFPAFSMQTGEVRYSLTAPFNYSPPPKELWAQSSCYC